MGFLSFFSGVSIFLMKFDEIMEVEIELRKAKPRNEDLKKAKP